MLPRARRLLDHDGRVRRPLLAPLTYTLEAVEDLVVSILGGRHAQRESRCLLRSQWHAARPQRTIGLPQQRERQHLNGDRGAPRWNPAHTLTRDAPRGALLRDHQ